MKKLFLGIFFILTHYGYAQNNDLFKEIKEAIHFAEKDENVHTVQKRNNRNVKIDSIFILPFHTIKEDNLKTIINEKYSLAYFIKDDQYFFYISDNKRTLKDYRKGRVAHYPSNGKISKMYNEIFHKAVKKNIEIEQIAFLQDNNLLENTSKPVFISNRGTKFLVKGGKIFNSLKSAVLDYK